MWERGHVNGWEAAEGGGFTVDSNREELQGLYKQPGQSGGVRERKASGDDGLSGGGSGDGRWRLV